MLRRIFVPFLLLLFHLMRKIVGLILTVAIATVVTSTASYAQREFHSDLAVDVLGLATQNLLQAQYEIRTDDATSIALRAEYVTKDVNGNTAIGIGAAYRFILNDDHAVRGLSVAPAADVYFFGNSNGHSSRVISLGADGAYKFVFGHFSVEPELQIRIGVSGAESVPKFNTTYFVPNVYLGYAW